MSCSGFHRLSFYICMSFVSFDVKITRILTPIRITLLSVRYVHMSSLDDTQSLENKELDLQACLIEICLANL
jgi:hypothetical protein